MSAERLHGNLSPCLAEFGAASGKDVLLKVLNQKLLTKARHEDSQVGMGVWYGWGWGCGMGGDVGVVWVVIWAGACT